MVINRIYLFIIPNMHYYHFAKIRKVSGIKENGGKNFHVLYENNLTLLTLYGLCRIKHLADNHANLVDGNESFHLLAYVPNRILRNHSAL